MHLLIHAQEVVLGVVFFDLLLQQLRLTGDPVVQRHHLGGRHKIARRLEPCEVGEQEARRVADAAIGVGHALEHFCRCGHLAAEVGRGHPQAQDVGTVFLEHFLGGNRVAQGLGHLVALGVHREPVGQHLPVGRHAIHGNGRLQRRLEPAAMLVRAFQIQIGGEAKALALLQHGVMGDTGIEPHVQRVGDLAVLGRFGAQQLFGAHLEPGVDAALLDAQRDFLDQLGRARMQRLGFLVHEQRDGHAPGALA